MPFIFSGILACVLAVTNVPGALDGSELSWAALVFCAMLGIAQIIGGIIISFRR